MATDVEPESAQEIAAALRDMVGSRGWHLFKAQAEAEWGEVGYARAMSSALASVPAGPDRAYQIAEVAERVDATARAVRQILQWPSEQLRKLAEPAKDRRPFAALRRSPQR